MEYIDFLGKGWNFPISEKQGVFDMSAGEDNIKQSIILILSTAKGERVMRPNFGCNLNDLAFAEAAKLKTIEIRVVR